MAKLYICTMLDVSEAVFKVLYYILQVTCLWIKILSLGNNLELSCKAKHSHSEYTNNSTLKYVTGEIIAYLQMR